MGNKNKSIFAALCILAVSLACQMATEVTPVVIVVTATPDLQSTVAAAIARTQTALAPTADIPATIAAGVVETQRAFKTPTITLTPPPPTVTPDMSTLDGDVNVALEKKVVDRAGGINWESWGHANDAVDYNSTTKPGGGRWGNETNNKSGTYQVIDLGQEYEITGVGYSLDWDGAFKNPLKFMVQVSNDLETWATVSEIDHPYNGVTGSNWVNVKLPIDPVRARYVKFWEPPDGAWNGWSDLFALRVYARTK
jgi:hypothetical protein